MAQQPKSNLVPARYIGQHPVNLRASLGPYWNIDGTRRTRMRLEQNETIMMPDEEVLGKTYLFDPRCINDPLYLGVGRRVLPEHAGLSEWELSVLGYQWHAGRPDMIPLNPQQGQEQLVSGSGSDGSEVAP